MGTEDILLGLVRECRWWLLSQGEGVFGCGRGECFRDMARGKRN